MSAQHDIHYITQAPDTWDLADMLDWPANVVFLANAQSKARLAELARQAVELVSEIGEDASYDAWLDVHDQIRHVLVFEVRAILNAFGRELMIFQHERHLGIVSITTMLVQNLEAATRSLLQAEA